MSMQSGKPDVVELARAQLDFGAMNSAAPSAKDILFKAQTIVPIAPRVKWEKYGAGAGAAALLCAALLLPWLPQQSRLSMAGVQFDVLLDPQQAQDLVNQAVRHFGEPGQEALLSADYAPQQGGGGLLMLKAAAFGESAARLKQRLAAGVEGGASTPAFAAYQVGESKRGYRISPWEALQASLRGKSAAAAGDLHPAAALASEVLAGEQLLREELAADLMQHGHLLTGFTFAGDSALLPAGCQFTVEAWPRPVAVGVKGYLKLASYQQAEVQQLVAAWLKRNNLRDTGLSLAGTGGATPAVAVEVLDRQGRTDSLLTARVNAVLQQPTPQQQADINFSMEQLVADAVNSVLPGIERRVDFERLSKLGEPLRYSVQITMLGRAEAGSPAAPDPVEDSSVREEW